MNLTDDWEQGVRDAWEYFRFKTDQLEAEHAFDSTKWRALRGIIADLDPVIYTMAFALDRDEKDGFSEGDIVTDFEGEECIITHVEEECIAVVYYDGRVENWMPSMLTKTGKRGCVTVKVPDEDGETV